MSSRQRSLVRPIAEAWRERGVGALRRQPGACPLDALAGRAREALDPTDTVCWAELGQGDMRLLDRSPTAAAAARDLAASAGLLP